MINPFWPSANKLIQVSKWHYLAVTFWWPTSRSSSCLNTNDKRSWLIKNSNLGSGINTAALSVNSGCHLDQVSIQIMWSRLGNLALVDTKQELASGKGNVLNGSLSNDPILRKCTSSCLRHVSCGRLIYLSKTGITERIYCHMTLLFLPT